MHTLTLRPLLPLDALAIPPADDPDPALASGYPRPGDNFSVDASSPGLGDLAFHYTNGPAMRYIAELRPGQEPVTLIALPGGQSGNRATGHFRDLMDRFWRNNDYFELPWTTAQIISAGEARWRFDLIEVEALCSEDAPDLG